MISPDDGFKEVIASVYADDACYFPDDGMVDEIHQLELHVGAFLSSLAEKI